MSRLHDLVADTVSNRLFRTMRVTQVSDLGPFREISLTSLDTGRQDPAPRRLPALVEHVAAAAAEHHESPLILTGRSTTIAAIRGGLKAAGHAQRTTRVRTYWDPRRTGLD
jgi:hypothetical protein